MPKARFTVQFGKEGLAGPWGGGAARGWGAKNSLVPGGWVQKRA